MKRLITLFLILALLLPAAALAVTGDSPYFGKWVAEEHHAIKHYDTVMHFVVINSNGPSSYMKFNLFHGGALSRPSSETETMYADSWEIVGDKLRVKTSFISYIDLYMDKEGHLLCDDPKLVFVKIP